MILRFYWEKWGIYFLFFIFTCVTIKYLRISDSVFIPVDKYLQLEENYTCSSELDLHALYDRVEHLNKAGREVRNWAQFGPVLADTPVLAVLAGRRAARLQLLLVSLAQVRDISSVLLVVSHSFYDENVNRLIHSIDFCMVLQIYFPYSLQLFPNVFPGLDPDDSCDNATDEDLKLCQQRDAASAEAKHHWWWTAHIVFEELAWSQRHRAMVTFLDEDSYVLPDFVHMLGFARRALAYVPEAQVLALGRPLAQDLDRDKLTVDSWRPPYDKGLTFNKTTWNTIKSMTEDFCTYDDASWSYSLLHAFEESQQGQAVMVACMAPRVVSTGIFQSGKRALEYMSRLSRSDDLFPSKVEAVMVFGRAGRVRGGSRGSSPGAGAGGWADVRDQLLCLDPLTSTLTTDPDYTTTSPIFTTYSLKP